MYKLTGEPAVGSFGWAGVVNDENIEGFRSIATPGAVAGLCAAHRKFGKLPLSEVVAPAVRIARDGFSPSWFNLYSIGLLAGFLHKYDELRRVFMPDGKMPTGDLANPPKLKQPDLANVLEAIGREGPDGFYKGDVAKAIVSDIRANGGILSEEDLANYKPFHWENGLEFGYRGHTVRVPPYACAGITSAMTLKLLDGFDVPKMGHNSVEMLHAYISCARLAYADRFRYIADPDSAEVPWNGLVSDAYTKRRRDSITDVAPKSFVAGDPWVEEGRRPTKELAASLPALVFDNDGLKMAVGASGGRRITNCVTSLIVKALDFGMGPQEAIDAPRVDCSTPATSVDPRISKDVIAALEAKGHTIQVLGEGFVQTGFASFASPVAIVKNADGLQAGVDTFHAAYAAGL
jgi:gamma-glutamyltranspeptidase/glutathione hydrolase